jgi:hypothetical protein
MPQTQFFALRPDLLSVLEAVESRGPLKYVKSGRSLSPVSEQYDRGADIPDLGKAPCESAIGSDTFLVCEPGVSVRVEAVEQSDGVRSFHTNQLINPDTVTFSSGGIWTAGILLYGRVASCSNSPASKRLMNRFRSAIKKHFVRIGAYYVGPGALELLKDGKRLTIAEQSPREFDLTLI